jgi:hypothetical protein
MLFRVELEGDSNASPLAMDNTFCLRVSLQGAVDVELTNRSCWHFAWPTSWILIVGLPSLTTNDEGSGLFLAKLELNLEIVDVALE